MSNGDAFPLNFKKIAGPGVPGMEDDIPVYHFDIADEDVPAMLADPIGFLGGRGIEEYQRMDQRAQMQVTMVATSRSTIGAHWCCYDIGEGRRCHLHEQPQE
jgi:hypothetical protein